LFFDIETSPNIGIFWRAGFKLNIGYENITQERKIICICYKWEGQKKVYSLTWDENACDKKMLQDFIKIANEADELVGHNGDRYDLPFLRTRCLFHDIDMFPTYTTIDTLKIAKNKFAFNSNRLDYISKFLGHTGKIKTNFQMWMDITLRNCRKTLGKMVVYCKGDVRELEFVFSRNCENIIHTKPTQAYNVAGQNLPVPIADRITQSIQRPG
jgi:predicted PolB exonuclease-like 3'-5' exonuclease